MRCCGQFSEGLRAVTRKRVVTLTPHCVNYTLQSAIVSAFEPTNSLGRKVWGGEGLKVPATSTAAAEYIRSVLSNGLQRSPDTSDVTD